MPGEADDVTIDMAQALSSMDNEFGGGDGGEGGSPPQSRQEASAAPSPAPAVAAAPAPAANPWDAPPKSWKQEHHSHWQKFDPVVRQYIHEREKQALDGLMQYKTAYDPYYKLEQQYKQWTDQYKMPLHQVSNNLIDAHLGLIHGEPEVKKQILNTLFQYPGVQDILKEMLGIQAPTGATEAAAAQAGITPQQVQQLVQKAVQEAVQPAVSRVQSWEQSQQARQLEESQKLVDAFIADPNNKYAQEAMPDMVRLVQAGLATDLKSAYEQACRMNPTIYAKMIEEEVQKATKRPGPGPKQVRSGQTPPASTKPADADEDMDETLRATFRDINSR